MKKMTVKYRVLIPMVSITLVCAITVLIFSIILYSDKVYDVLYEKTENSKNGILTEFSNIKERLRIAATEADNQHILYSLVLDADPGELFRQMEDIRRKESFDYYLITDANGIVLINTQTTDRNGEDVSGLEQIRRALDGEVNTAINDFDDAVMRITATSPIHDANGNIVATATFGVSMNNRPFANQLRELAGGCDLIIYSSDALLPQSTTLTIAASFNISSEYREIIIDDVLGKGQTYIGPFDFYGVSFLSVFSPLYEQTGLDDNDSIVGVLFVGTPNSDAVSEIMFFALWGSLITLVLLVTAIFISLVVSGKINRQFSDIVKHMTHRDKLLEAVNAVSVILLEIDEADDIRTPLVSGMGLIGSAMNVDQIHLWHTRKNENDITQFVREYTWVNNYVKHKSKVPKYLISSHDDDKSGWMKKFLANEYISGVIAEMEPEYREFLKPLGAKSVTLIPIFLENQFWGLFTIDSMSNDEILQEGEIAILRSTSLMMANIVRRHALQNENLKIYYDALTGINNRRFFDKTMSRLISSLSRAGGSLSLMMIDVDNFKKYNDTYGHSAGDECLIKVAEILNDSVNRIDDFVARYGGEEFVVVMPNTDRDGAVLIAEAMILNIKAANILHKASETADYVTFSIGITTGVVTQYHTPDTFIQKADDMLYKSKDDGRNRYTFGELEN
ncbi:MAG: diguanylate cyclase [Oscillospiraceae bacterium]|nr:diguanylate cyclase [Oscillospiraceae bacterium]